MDTWNRLTDLRGEGMGGLEEINQKTYMHTCKAHGHRQQCGEDQGGWGGGLVEGRLEGNGVSFKFHFIVDICNSINNEMKLK